MSDLVDEGCFRHKSRLVPKYHVELFSNRDTPCPQVNQRLLKIDKLLITRQYIGLSRVTLFVFDGPDSPPALD